MLKKAPEQNKRHFKKPGGKELKHSQSQVAGLYKAGAAKSVSCSACTEVDDGSSHVLPVNNLCKGLGF